MKDVEEIVELEQWDAQREDVDGQRDWWADQRRVVGGISPDKGDVGAPIGGGGCQQDDDRTRRRALRKLSGTRRRRRQEIVDGD
jgi:hypothetical protein